MDLQKLFGIQSELDKRINKEHGLEEKNLIPYKILALQVELGELANETRCFKFWSTKEASPKEVILEEYVDCLHFILSIGLDSGFENIEFRSLDDSNDIIDQFRIVFSHTVKLQQEPVRESYEELFDHFILLGNMLGFADEEVYEAYLDKNKINHQRQDEGY